MMQSNQPYQRVSSQDQYSPSVAGGAAWGAGWGAATAGLHGLANQYMQTGDLEKMKKVDVYMPEVAKSMRASYEAGMRSESRFIRWGTRAGMAHGWKANLMRVGAGAAISGVIGGLHNASDGVVGNRF